MDENERELRQHWQTMVGIGRAVPDSGLSALAGSLEASGPWPEDLRDSPVILDTDIGGDGDDALAVVAAARTLPTLAAVVTSDEVPGGERARFARHLLDQLGRDDVVVVSGANLGNTRYYVVDGLTPDYVPAQRANVAEVVHEVCSSTEGPVRWVGMAPLSNLAHILATDPVSAARLRVTQMGGALAYRHADCAEHNIRLDVHAARAVLDAVREGRLATPEFIASEVTFTPRMEVSADSEIYRGLSADGAPAWARLLADHLDQWFDRFHPSTIQHDALTLTAALDLPFVDSDIRPVTLDDIGRTIVDDARGVPLRWSLSAAYEPFMQWLRVAIDPERNPAALTSARTTT